MASKILTNPQLSLSFSKTNFSPLFPSGKSPRCPGIHFSLRQNPSSNSSGSSPPSSREEAINQAKISLSTTLQKPLNNVSPLQSKKLKRQKQPRFSVEIPVADESLNSLAQLVFEMFSDLPIKRKGQNPRFLIVWPSAEGSEMAQRIFSSPGLSVENVDFGRSNSVNFSSTDIGVIISPEPTMIDQVKNFCENIYPKPVVLLNPNWGFEEKVGDFSGSFEVLYSFVGLEVKGLLSKKKGAVFRCVKDGILSGDGWAVLVEDEEKKGEMKVVMRFRKRPSMAEVESVLYNLQAANSPVTKSVKFFKQLVENVQKGGGK